MFFLCAWKQHVANACCCIHFHFRHTHTHTNKTTSVYPSPSGTSMHFCSLPLLLILSLQLSIPNEKQNPHAKRNFTSNWKLVLLRAAYSKWAAQQVELVRPDSVAHSSAAKLQNQPTHAHTLTYVVERASSTICFAPTLRWLANKMSEWKSKWKEREREYMLCC